MRRTICTFCPEKKCLALEVSGRSGNRQIPLNELAMRALTKHGLNDVPRRQQGDPKHKLDATKNQLAMVALINLALGWSLLGWLLTLVGVILLIRKTEKR